MFCQWGYWTWKLIKLTLSERCQFLRYIYSICAVLEIDIMWPQMLMAWHNINLTYWLVSHFIYTRVSGKHVITRSEKLPVYKLNSNVMAKTSTFVIGFIFRIPNRVHCNYISRHLYQNITCDGNYYAYFSLCTIY